MIQIKSPAVQRTSPHFRRPCVTMPLDEGNRPYRRPRITIAPANRAFCQIPCKLSLFAFFLAPEQFFHVTALAIFQVFSFFALNLLVGNVRGRDLVVSLQSPPHIVSSSWRIYIALYVIAVVMVGTAPKYLKQLTTITYSFHSAPQVH
jgi:hypothetical protein